MSFDAGLALEFARELGVTLGRSDDAMENKPTLAQSRAARRFVMDELFGGAPGVTDRMAFWLANLSLNRLGHHAPAIYRALCDAGLRSTIPIDNRTFVLGEDGDG